MMRAVEIYMTIVVTLMTTTLGLPETCLHYCNFLPEYSSIPPGCDCSLSNLRKTRSKISNHIATPPKLKDSGIYYEPVKLNFSQNITFDKETLHNLHMLNIKPIFDSKQNTFNGTKHNKHLITVNIGELLAEQDNSDENDSKFSNKSYKRRDSYFPEMIEQTKELPFYLYLDISINASENDNRPQLEELKNMFENFQATEKDLSECINLHIYIFSKRIDNIDKTNTNWGRRVEHDNLSSNQQLTEIQSKCDRPASIIKHSIYQIKQFLSQEDKSTEFIQNGQGRIYSDESNKDTQTATTESQNVKTTTNDMYSDVLSTQTGEKVNNNFNAATETSEKTDDVQLRKYSERDNWFINDLSNMNNNDTTSTPPFYDDQTETVYNNINLATTDASVVFGDYEDLRKTNKTDRTIFSEGDMTIPRILTKEFSNGTVMSVVNGYEKIPNSDFITNSIMPTASNSSTISNSKENNESLFNPDFLKANVDKIVQSDGVNIHGNLYFSFGKKQIPARFIQQSDGELNVAVDGFSMCDQLLEDNISNFMKLLCKCIKHQNCT